jgi:hypothetical protein
MSLVEQELLTLPEHRSSPPVFSGVRVTRSLVPCVCFVDRCLSFCPFSFDHCIICSALIYGYDYICGIFKLFLVVIYICLLFSQHVLVVFYICLLFSQHVLVVFYICVLFSHHVLVVFYICLLFSQHVLVVFYICLLFSQHVLVVFYICLLFLSMC